MKAFNYQTQQWVSGKEAKALLLSQLNEELEMLQSDKGESYWLSIRRYDSVKTLASYTKEVRDRIAELQ